MLRPFLCVALLFLCGQGMEAMGASFKVDVVKDGLGVPWGMDFFSSDTLIVTEREGKMSLLDVRTGQLTVLEGVPVVYHRGQGGLLDVMVHQGKVYFTWSKKVGRFRYTTVLSRAEIHKNKLHNMREIFVTNAFGSGKRHFGSRILYFQGHLYLTVGDRGEREKAQDLSVHNGKVLRIEMDGSIPSDNPFEKSAVWSYGHRNPQGLALNPETGEIWLQEHGPRGGDEINIVKKGGNYGWPVITYGKEYWGPSIGEGTHKKGMIQPAWHFTPSIAPCGLTFYTGTRLKEWTGTLFSGALKLHHLNALVFKNGKVEAEKRLLEELEERIRDVIQGPDELLYLSTDSGKILRLSPMTTKSKAKK